jgi:DNA polymerase-2
MHGFILNTSSSIIDGKTIVQLFGKLENGQSFVSLNTTEPYFFIEEKHVKAIKKYLSKFKTQKTDFKTSNERKVVKISSSTQTELHKLFKTIHKKVPTYEADIKPAQRFLMDNNLLGTIDLEGEYESSEKVDRVYREPTISPAEFRPKPKLLSLDIETDQSFQNLICVGLYGENYKKVFYITDKKLDNPNVVLCKDEADCLEKFRKEIIKQDPDIITGWNVIDFDLKFLEARFKKHKIPFDIGRTNSSVKIRIESDFFRASSANIPGRQVLDGLNLIRDPFLQQSPTMRYAQFVSYTLEDVAQEILKTGKLIKRNLNANKIDLLYEENTPKSHNAIADYNLNDCKLVYNILEKTQLIELAIERSKLTGLALNRLTASIAAFDSLYIREAHKRKIVSQTSEFKPKEERIKGGYVQSPEPGIYHNVLVFDFKSLYPSVIKTFNIDPFSYLEKKGKGSIESPNKAYFKNEQGILPQILEKIHKAREETKKQGKELSNYALKTIQNSFWGVLASPNCRYFNLKMANAITSFCRWIIQTTAKKIEEKGYRVIYSDTDSNFVETKLEKEKANTLAKELKEDINKFWKEHIETNFNRPSYLELEFEKQYLSFMIPRLRGKDKETAAKKRYAGLIEKDGKEEVQVTGLEAIRGDWIDAAREFQKELLMKLFKKEPIAEFIRSFIKKVRSGELDKKLIYRKSLRKPLHQYTKTTPPHVKAAKLLDELKSNIIEYYLTTAGPEPIQNHKHKLDYEHYIKKQIQPIATQVLQLINKDFDDIINKSKQSTLF